MPERTPDIVVVGAGIIGMTAALVLHRSGAQVTLIEAGLPGAESTWAGGGIVSPTPPWRYPVAVQTLVARSRTLYPALIDELESTTGIDCEYRRCNLLLLADALQGGTDWLRNHRAETGPAGRFEALLSEPEQPALCLPDIAQVRNPRLAQALWRYLQALRVPIVTHRRVDALWLQGKAVKGVCIAGDNIAAGRVLLACGAWTDQVLTNSGLDGIGSHPVKGQMLLFKCAAPPIRHIVTDGNHYLIPRADGRVLCGSTVEYTGFDPRPSAAGHEQLLQGATRLLPALHHAQLEAHWAGLRPGIAGDLPMIGPYPGIADLWLSAGHYRNGLGMAPAAAELLAGQIAGGRTQSVYLPRPLI